MSSKNRSALPILDLQLDGRTKEALAKDTVDAFKKYGFIYVKNHGIESELYAKLYKKSVEFFRLPSDVKEKYTLKTDWVGYVKPGREKLDKTAPADYKEAFNYHGVVRDSQTPTENELPGFREIMTTMHTRMGKVADFILELIAIGLGWDPNDVKASYDYNSTNCPSMLRTLYYPELPKDVELLPGTMRCGEHTDYGLLTVLAQDDCGGLEVLSADNEWINAEPIPGTFVVNICDLLQRWSGDRVRSTKHRVRMPDKDDPRARRQRQSVAFFIFPKLDCIIRCCDGNEKYPPISAKDYLDYKYKLTL